MFPELFKIPGLDFTVNTYGVLIAVAFLTGTLLAARLGERDGIDRGKMYDLCLYMLIASLFGSRILLVVTEWSEYSANPSQLFSLQFLRSGGVFYGGLIGAVAASVGLMAWYKMPWWKTADACAPGIALGQFFGRLGCFSAGCCWGKPTTSWVGVTFPEAGFRATGVPTACPLHPTQLYESVAALGLCFFLLYLGKRRAFEGQIVLTYFFGYGLIRYVIEYFRDDPRGGLFGYSTSQLIALLFMATATGFVLFLRRKPAPNSTATNDQI